jgi:hypothetical protein
MKATTNGYCQHLLNTTTNYTCSYYGDNIEGLSGDKIERLLKKLKLKPREIWDFSKDDLVVSPNGCIIFDDTVIDHNHSKVIEGVRKQWSGNQHKIIRGIGLIGCVYYNPEVDKSWLIDYRIFDPDTDGLKKTEHAMEMYKNVIHSKDLTHQYVLFDAAYATNKIMALVEKYNHYFLCNIKSNRLVTEILPDIKPDYKPVKILEIPEQGLIVRLNKAPARAKVKLFRITVSENRTDYIITNDLSISSPNAIKEVNGMRWNIEQFHREIKQLTGIELCQCRKNRSQRNHINMALRVWLFLKRKAIELETTVYQVKERIHLKYYLMEMRKPSLKFNL